MATTYINSSTRESLMVKHSLTKRHQDLGKASNPIILKYLKVSSMLLFSIRVIDGKIYYSKIKSELRQLCPGKMTWNCKSQNHNFLLFELFRHEVWFLFLILSSMDVQQLTLKRKSYPLLHSPSSLQRITNALYIPTHLKLLQFRTTFPICLLLMSTNDQVTCLEC